MNTKHHNILIVTPEYPPLVGGIATQCELLVNEFSKMKIGVDVLCEYGQEKYNDLPGSNALFLLNYFRKIKYVGYILAFFNLILFFLKYGSKYDLIIIRQIGFNALVLGLLRSLKIIRCKTFVTADSGAGGAEMNALSSSRAKHIYGLLIKQHDYINSISPDNYNQYLKSGFPKCKLTSIDNGVDTSMYEESNKPKKIRKFLYIGRLIETKGIKELLEAFNKVVKLRDDIELVIAGNGKLLGYVKEFISGHKLEGNITYMGVIQGVEKDKVFANIDCIVLPSYREGYGLVFAEAAARKKLLIGTNVGGSKKRYGENIIICEQKNVDSLYKSILYAVVDYDLSKLNYDNIIEGISVKNTCNDILNLI